MNKKVVIKEEKRIFNDFLKIDEGLLQYEQFDGTMSPVLRRLKGERGDSVAAIIWHTDLKKVSLVNQFRYPTYQNGDGWIYELVAGAVKKDEDPYECMLREIEEEMGYKVEELEKISVFYTSPGGTSERMFLYYAEVSEAQKVSEGGGLVEENEDIEVAYFTKDELWRMMEEGKIVDAKTIIGIQWLRMKE